jgi:hypothetical protein
MSDLLIRNSTDCALATLARNWGKQGMPDISSDYEGREREIFSVFYAEGFKRSGAPDVLRLRAKYLRPHADNDELQRVSA